MKVCFATAIKKGLESKVYNHFGSAPIFLIVDSESNKFEEIENGNIDHTHGKCNPLLALLGNKIDAVVVGGIGNGALSKLKSEGVTIYQSEKGTVQENLQLFRDGKLNEVQSHHACTDHDCSDHDHDHGSEYKISSTKPKAHSNILKK